VASGQPLATNYQPLDFGESMIARPMRFEFLEVLEQDWEPMPKAGLIAWLVFYIFFLVQAVGEGSLRNLMDLVFVPVHEGGHALFGWLGYWPLVLGGTLLQLLVPAALACYFLLRRQLPGTAFCAFFFFENFLPIATYMADSRKQELE